MTEQSDIIQAIQRGDASRFETLVEPYLPRLRRELLAVTRSPRDVDDLLQDTLLRAWRALPTYVDDGRFESWLRTIARNVGLNEVRRRIARSIARVDSLEECEPPPDRTTPEDAAIAAGKLVEIERLFAELPAEQREVFVLHLLSGMSFKDIAEQQDVSINTALGRMHRVRQKLARLLRGLWYGMPARLRPWLAVAGAAALLAMVLAWGGIARTGGAYPAPAAGPLPDAGDPPADATPWYDDFDFAAVGAIGYWPQDRDPYDQTGTWPDGEWTAGERVPGRFGEAWSLRPGRYFESTRPAHLRSLAEFTTAAWFWPEPNHFEDTGHLIGIGNDVEPGLLAMRVATPGRAILACVATGESGAVVRFYDPFPDWFGRWHHVACTYGPGDGMRLYVDGSLAVPPAVNADGSPNASRPDWQGAIAIERARAPLWFNKSRWDNAVLKGEASRLSGLLDEVVLFDRALDPAEVAALAADADGNGRADFWDAALRRQ